MSLKDLQKLVINLPPICLPKVGRKIDLSPELSISDIPVEVDLSEIDELEFYDRETPLLPPKPRR